jgi:hypothetical protein
LNPKPIPNPPGLNPELTPAGSSWPKSFEPSPEPNQRAANEIAFPARRPPSRRLPPPKTDVPKLSKPPNNKFGINEKSDPIIEFEKPKPPKSEFPKPELAKSEVPNRALPKLPIERPVECEENRDIAGEPDEKRFDLKLQREASISGAYPRLALAEENPDEFVPKFSYFEFPNECHWPPARTLFLEPPGTSSLPPLELPKECHPPPVADPEVRANPRVDRKSEFPNDCHPPMKFRKPCPSCCEALE